MTAVTGATGFIGHACAAALISAGEAVVCTTRPQSNTSSLRKLEPSPVILPGLLNDQNALTEAFSGCQAVVNCAARAIDWGSASEFERDNVAGAVNVIEAASRAGVTHVVHMSTANAGGYGRRNMNESNRGARGLSLYSRSKVAAEQAARTSATKLGVKLTILRPSAVYGPGDRRWTLPMLERIEAGSWALVNQGRALLTPLYIHNLTKGLLIVLERRAPGTFILTDDVTVSWREFTVGCARALGVSASTRSIPYALARPIAEAAELYGRLSGRSMPPLITRYRVIRAAKDFHYRCDRARRELGYCPDRDLGSHLRECAGWYYRVTSL